MPKEDRSDWVAVESDVATTTSKVKPAISAYQFFQKDVTEEVKAELHSKASTEEGGKFNVGDFSRAVRDKWNALDDERKEHYESLALKDQYRFNSESHAADVAALERREKLQQERDQLLLDDEGGVQRTTRKQQAKKQRKKERKEKKQQAKKVAAAIKQKNSGAGDDEEEFVDEDDSESSGSYSEGSESESDSDSSRKEKKKAKSAPRQLSQKQIEHRENMKRVKAEKEAIIQEKQEDLRKEKAAQAKKRLDFLLKQSNIFSHFGAVVEDKATYGVKAGEKAPASGSRRDVVDDDKEAQELNDAEKTTFLTAQPTTLGFGKMRPYQLEGLNWMIGLQENGVNGILADEMGLGKTLQSISVLVYMMEYQNSTGPHLIVVPKSTLSNWMNELSRWAPQLVPVKFHGDKATREDIATNVMCPGQRDEDRKWHVCVTTYEVCNIEKNVLNKFAWQYLIIDEAHRLKNEASTFSVTVRGFETRYRILLTGTPLQNSLHELWALLNFLVPDVFASAEQFDEWFNLDIEDNDEKNKLISQLHKILRPFMLRRLKKEVEKNLPPKHETILYTGMSAMQKKLYRDILIRDIDAIQGNSGSRTAILNIVMQLRKCAGHPYLFPGVEDRTLPPLGEHLVENCGKMVLLDKLLKRLKERGDRVLLFTQMTRILDIMEDYLVMRRYNYCRIDGNTTYEVREDYIDSFNKPDSEKFIFLLSTRAGGLGINLQTANVVILYDSDWNPQADLQAQDRAHRIGQKKEVQVFRFVTEHTVEEKIVERAQQKLKLDAMVVQQGRLKEKDKQLSRDDLLEAVRFGADKIFKSKDSSITDDDIDLILDAGKRKTQELNEKLQAADKGDMLDFKLDGSSNFQQFEGVDYSMNALAQAKAEAEMFGILDMGKRERKTVANYNENKLYQQQMAAGQVPSKPKKKKKNFKLPKELRLPRMEEWQMFNRERLLQIQEEEEKKFRDLPEEVQKRATAKKSDVVEVKEEEKKSESNEGESAGDVKMEDAAAVKSEPSADEKATSGGPSEVKAEVKEEGGDNDSPNSDEPFELPKLLDEETQAEKEELLAEGFSDWKRADYTAFVKASARYGRSNHEKIATEVGKSIPDVKAFAEAFWGHLGQQRIAEHEYDRVVKQIERGEKKIEEIKSLQRGARILISLFENPWDELEFNHINTNANTKDKLFSPENDRHLLCWAHKFGYGQWGAVKMAIRRSPRFRFDYFFRSCPLDMIGRRCELLMRCAGKEVEALERKAREDAGLPTEAEEGKELPPIELPPYKELQRRQRLASRKKFEEEKQDLESKVDNLETQIKAIQQQLKDLTNQANLPPPPPPPPPAQKENKVTNGDAKPAKKRTRSMDESPASENVAPTPASAPESSSKKESSPSDFDPSKGDLVDGEFVEFPEYDGSEEPKEPKKPFTQFCIRTRKEVKQSLDESERKNKSLVNEKLKDMWLKLEDQQKAVFRSWAAWDKKRYARDEEIYSKAKKQAKKKKKKSKSANESSIDSLHVPKKRQAGDSLSIPKKKRKS